VKYAATEMNTTTNNNKQEKTMSKRYYKEFSEYTFGEIEVRVRDIKRNEVEFCIWCDDESHADALVKELNRRGYDIGEFHAIMIAVNLKVKS
jgi:dTDP-4-amino-4,6-dideoxygalactose transaminase